MLPEVTASMHPDDPQFELLADLGAQIAREVALDELLARFAARVAAAMDAERATLWLLDDASGALRSHVAVLPEADELRVPPGVGVVGHVAATGAAVRVDDASADPRWSATIDRQTGYRTTSILAVPVRARGQVRGVLQLLGKRGGPFAAADERYAAALADQIGRALDYTSLRGDDARQGVPLGGRYNHVVGASPTMQALYDVIARAAATDATVLVRGETGTGKGVVARAIHVNSRRAEAPLVHVDCTTLPQGLVESELFGHERGAYTGADTRVAGKVELADGGTLFLDEIGELPLPLQGKLLRFVQERRFERVGGRQALTADVRLVAATNRDLAQMVADGTFRADLYFRLRVVEVEVAPLRARGADDILALAHHFLGVYGRRHRRPSMLLSPRAVPVLVAHPWPGNVRELEFAIERAVVLSADDTIEAHELGLEPPRAPTGAQPAVAAPSTDDLTLPPGLPLAEVERRYAAAAVARAGGNHSEAARTLGISRGKLTRLLRG
ncbi:MAG: sigma-54-dependent Fis family transcriptional regulator [Kofleriaceae bacterium]